ncbi:hypothetical protein, partial [Streptococcus thoraltensis]
MSTSPITKQILRKAIESPVFSKEVLPITPLDIFEGNEVYKELSLIISRYYKANRKQLTEEALLVLVEEKLTKMRKDAETQQKYFNAVNDLYEVRDSSDNNVIDEKIEKHIRKYMRMELLKKAATNLDNESMMESLDEEWSRIQLMDISGKQQEIINVIDDAEYKRKVLATLNQNTIPTGFKAIDQLNSGGLA